MGAKLSFKSLILSAARNSFGERLFRAVATPPTGRVDWQHLRRTVPVSRWFGADRGTPLDRVYIEQFLQKNTAYIQGRILEVAEDTYSRRFGGGRLESVDILHATEGNPAATIIADLANAPAIPDNQYDCIIITQTLQMIYDVRAALQTLHRILKPEGTLLATLPGISQISRSDMDQWGDFWRFTSASAQRLFEESFANRDIAVEVYGNVLSASAFLFGLAAEDLLPDEISARDADYQMLIGVRASKASNSDTNP